MRPGFSQFVNLSFPTAGYRRQVIGTKYRYQPAYCLPCQPFYRILYDRNIGFVIFLFFLDLIHCLLDQLLLGWNQIQTFQQCQQDTK